jgi:hypothetical protein
MWSGSQPCPLPCRLPMAGRLSQNVARLRGMISDTDLDGWSVYDPTTGLPVEVNGMVQVGLFLEDADNLADLLNRLHAEQLAAPSH